MISNSTGLQAFYPPLAPSFGFTKRTNIQQLKSQIPDPTGGGGDQTRAKRKVNIGLPFIWWT